jgi:flagellar motor switch/type III secretory pathway protein FliN
VPNFSPYPFERLRRITRADAALESHLARWLATTPTTFPKLTALAGPISIALTGGTPSSIDPHASLAEVRFGGLSILFAASSQAIRTLAQQHLGGPDELPAPRPLTTAEHAIWCLVLAAALADMKVDAKVWPAFDMAIPVVDAPIHEAATVVGHARAGRPDADAVRPAIDLSRPADARPTADAARHAADAVRPAIDLARPVADAASPADADALRPAVDFSRPAADAARSAGDAARPAADGARPAGASRPVAVDAARPAIDVARPVDAARPIGDVARPIATDAMQPAADALRPAVDVARPSADAVRPAIDLARPSADAVRPAIDLARPAAEGARHIAPDAARAAAIDPHAPTRIAPVANRVANRVAHRGASSASNTPGAWRAVELAVVLGGVSMTVVAFVPRSLELRTPPSRGWPAWTFDIPIVVGRSAIERAAISQLGVGDIITVERTLELQIGDGRIGLTAAPRAVEATVSTGYLPRDMTLPDDAHLELTVQLGTTRMSLRALSELAVGQIVSLGRPLAGPFEVRAAGRLVGQGELVDVDGELGVRIVSLAQE